MSMVRRPRDYPETIESAESGRPMRRGEKLVSFSVEGRVFEYLQPGWWCNLDDPSDVEGQLVDEDNEVAEMARRTAEAIVKGESFPPLLIRAIRIRCGLSQREAGQVFGTGDKSFEKYEAGQIRPSAPTRRLLQLAMKRPDFFTKPPKGKMSLPSATDATLIRKTIKDAHLDRIYERLFADRAS
ncbi:type II TA system antitoxin MqsA family protein [Inquilinus sp. NPDC058860]|uniref:type II TA system antitoxin MqsA family protein n=1 Tax=Inquilinus sp. NPDC058860 TaxID=3346652 RepID=UPI0036887462